MTAWLYKWRHLIAYVAVGIGAVWGFGEARRSRQFDVDSFANQARIERETNVHICQESNERTKVVADFLHAALADPNPHQFDFITDPQLRQGVIDETRQTRAAMRARVDGAFVPRDCEAQYPAPTLPTTPPPTR